MIWIWSGEHSGALRRGRLVAPTLDQARAHLRSLAVRPMRLRVERALEGSLVHSQNHRALPMLLRKLGMMLRAGMSPAQALQHLAGDAPKALAEALQQIVLELNAGHGLRRAFERADLSDAALSAALGAAELSGNLAEVVSALADMQQNRAELLRALRSSFTYPAVLLGMGAGLCLLTVHLLVPVYRDIYADTESLPGGTQLLFTMADLSASSGFWVGLLAGLALAWFSLRRLGRHARTHILLLRTPLIGELIRSALLAHTLRLLGTLGAHGVDLHRSIEVCRAQARNPLLLDMLAAARTNLEHGRDLSEVFVDAHLGADLPALLSMSGRTADLSAVMHLAAEYYADRLTLASERLRALLEPLSISLIGIVIGSMLMALYLPLFSLGEAL
ncbi:MAG: type II secretion system F family protein [Gammaproteobacteria bacterium AqS3]|nr:type II secretion system F family protein [Gammaproteobacteria bacterium AqS3]